MLFPLTGRNAVVRCRGCGAVFVECGRGEILYVELRRCFWVFIRFFAKEQPTVAAIVIFIVNPIGLKDNQTAVFRDLNVGHTWLGAAQAGIRPDDIFGLNQTDLRGRNGQAFRQVTLGLFDQSLQTGIRGTLDSRGHARTILLVGLLGS